MAFRPRVGGNDPDLQPVYLLSGSMPVVREYRWNQWFLRSRLAGYYA